jgi:hypothetical protein
MQIRTPLLLIFFTSLVVGALLLASAGPTTAVYVYPGSLVVLNRNYDGRGFRVSYVSNDAIGKVSEWFDSRFSAMQAFVSTEARNVSLSCLQKKWLSPGYRLSATICDHGKYRTISVEGDDVEQH